MKRRTRDCLYVVLLTFVTALACIAAAFAIEAGYAWLTETKRTARVPPCPKTVDIAYGRGRVDTPFTCRYNGSNENVGTR